MSASHDHHEDAHDGPKVISVADRHPRSPLGLRRARGKRAHHRDGAPVHAFHLGAPGEFH